MFPRELYTFANIERERNRKSTIFPVLEQKTFEGIERKRKKKKRKGGKEARRRRIFIESGFGGESAGYNTNFADSYPGNGNKGISPSGIGAAWW